MIILDLSKSFTNQKEVPLSRFVDEITYIPLETTQEALITENAIFEVTEEYIVARNRGSGKYQILLFDRQTGKFLREIGKQGRGPGEFSIWSRLPYNPVKKELYAISASKEILVYNLSGKNIDKIRIPDWKDPKIPKMANPKLPSDLLQRSLIQVDNLLDSDIFVGYIINSSGWEKKKLVLSCIIKRNYIYLLNKRQIYETSKINYSGQA